MHNVLHIRKHKISSVAARFSRLCMPPPASNPGPLTVWPWNWCASCILGGEPSFQIWAC